MTSEALPGAILDEIIVAPPSFSLVGGGSSRVILDAYTELYKALLDSEVSFVKLTEDEMEDVHPHVCGENSSMNGAEFHLKDEDPGLEKWLSLFSSVKHDRENALPSQELLQLPYYQWLCEHRTKICLVPHGFRSKATSRLQRDPSVPVSQLLNHIIDPSTDIATGIDLLEAVETVTGGKKLTAVRTAWSLNHNGAIFPHRETVGTIPTIIVPSISDP